MIAQQILLATITWALARSVITGWLFELSIVLDLPFDAALALLCAGWVGPKDDRTAELSERPCGRACRRELARLPAGHQQGLRDCPQGTMDWICFLYFGPVALWSCRRPLSSVPPLVPPLVPWPFGPLAFWSFGLCVIGNRKGDQGHRQTVDPSCFRGWGCDSIDSGAIDSIRLKAVITYFSEVSYQM